MNCIIIDDDPIFIREFREVLHEFFADETLEIKSRSEDFQNVPSKQYDYYFIDIDLQSLSGIDLTRQLVKTYPLAKVIFVTSRQDLVFDALSTQPFYFIRKNYLREDLKIFKALHEEEKKKRHLSLTINEDKNKFMIPYDDILYLEVTNHMLSIITKSDCIEARMSLKEIYDYLDKDQFGQIQKSRIINFMHVKMIVKNSITLDDGSVFTISRFYINQFEERYHNFLLQ